ncbi:carbonic anhydrase [Micropruina sp.]|uniref:carbonic anhydrase n=1 Tax=Micropruina sp. TaxID=2737536 RepID=UPI0039E71BB3
MAALNEVPDWMRPPGLPSHRMPSAQALQRLKAGNARYVTQRSGEGHSPGSPVTAEFPFAVVVGCLEPDAAGEHLFAETPGAVQCVRTAGPSLGADTMAAIEYAVLVQNVSLVLVLGHQGCGALRAAADARAAGSVPLPGELTGWVSRAATGTRLGDPATGHVRALRAVLHRADSLLTLIRSGEVKIAAGVLAPATGAIEFLPDEPDEVEDDCPSVSRRVELGS